MAPSYNYSKENHNTYFCFQPFGRNGRWRSVWTIREEGGQAEITGILKVQVHYYEDGNVQLVSSKEIKDTISKSVSILIQVFSCEGFPKIRPLPLFFSQKLMILIAFSPTNN